MTKSQIEKVARAVLGPDEDLRGLDERALMMVTVARKLGKLPLEAQGDGYLEAAFKDIATSVGVRSDATRLDDPNLDVAPPPADPRTASVEQLRARATKARADAARASETAYLGTPADAPPKPAAAEQRKDAGSASEAARARMLEEAKGAWRGEG